MKHKTDYLSWEMEDVSIFTIKTKKKGRTSNDEI